jgi:hypothetical protein
MPEPGTISYVYGGLILYGIGSLCFVLEMYWCYRETDGKAATCYGVAAGFFLGVVVVCLLYGLEWMAGIPTLSRLPYVFEVVRMGVRVHFGSSVP